MFGLALAYGDINKSDPFDRTYAPVPSTDPSQHIARSTTSADRVLSTVREPLLQLDPHVVFRATVDANGYLPTHNPRLLQPQESDPIWNVTSSRSRRLFMNHTGLRAARNTEVFLLQTYRRDMGNGMFVIMEDVSAPICIKDRHWGGFRIGYKVASQGP